MPSFHSSYGIKSVGKRTENSLSKCASALFHQQAKSSLSLVRAPPTVNDGWFDYTMIKFESALNVTLVSPDVFLNKWALLVSSQIHVPLVFVLKNQWDKKQMAASNHFLIPSALPDALSFENGLITLLRINLFTSSGLLKLTKKKLFIKTVIKPLNSVTIWSFATNCKLIFNRKQLSGNDNHRGGEWLVLH